MVLDDFKLIEVSATGISFEHLQMESGQGTIEIDYGEIEFEAGGVLVGNESQSTVQVKAAPSISGRRLGVNDNDFILKINMRMLFVCPRTEELNEDFLQSSSWYFGSMLRTHFKFYADEILNKTTIKGVQLPYN
ncbi:MULTISPECIES: hypothetical protein [Atlantibacter]|uniref:hypothetical protein n=1 Tax=Atlantibacter TaxID=1903434 RepID=UPI00289E1CA7|nr:MULTISPECIES: hypothetical protein [Atlantibacter]